MSFRPKNTSATYQRMMNTVFFKQIGRNMEVYMNDILIKSKKPRQHQQDLEETFKTLRWYDMRLNLKKCAFKVKVGKFLGFMLTEWGIEVNLTKCRAIIDMKIPTSIKEGQTLNNRLVALTWFISRSADNFALFFHVLKNNKTFKRTNECE